ncbi:MAG: hypothetical protein LQ352_006426 [Teloschistes flavicans]|nr:MAG: hypothetical protein LQ352_006426 [Teloschistes flavicans]
MTAINQFFTSWSTAIQKIATGSPATLQTAAQPADFDDFAAAHNNGQTNIDTALANLIKQAPKNDQNAALMVILPTLTSTLEYDGSNVVAETVEKGLQVRLAQLLKHVETDLDAFVAFAKAGAFSTAKIEGAAELVKAIWPEGGQVGSIES